MSDVMTQQEVDRYHELIAMSDEVRPKVFGMAEYYRGAMHKLVAFNQGYGTTDVEELLADVKIGLDILCDTDRELVAIAIEVTNLVSYEPVIDAEIVHRYWASQAKIKKLILDLAETFCGPMVSVNDAIDQVDNFAEPISQIAMTMKIIRTAAEIGPSVKVGEPRPIGKKTMEQAMILHNMPPALRRMLEQLGTQVDIEVVGIATSAESELPDVPGNE